MGNQDKRNILMAGFPGTGKSTYLAAFWQLVETHSDIVDGSLRLYDKAPPEREYLNRIRNSWEVYEPITRNISGEIKDAYMDLDNGHGQAVRLNFPDLSGEIYTTIFEGRSWNEEYNQLIASTDRLVVFVNDDISQGSPTISEVQDIAGDAEPALDGMQNAGTEWEIGHTPKQVQYIDLLQLLLGQYSGTPIKKISIVISAWDELRDEGRTPEGWLKHHAPMFYQYIKANGHMIHFHIFGVSAQGDAYEGEKLDALQNKKLSERPLIMGVQDSNISEHDITYPIRWLFE